METMISQRIQKLREEMQREGISVYIIPTGDYHQSEYISEYFKEREYITGFTGSAGTAVVTMQEVCLWTDGRYFIQAEKELQGSNIELFRSGMTGVLTVQEYLKKNITPKDCLGFDGRIVSANAGKEYRRIAEDKKAALRTERNLIDKIWEDRPEFPSGEGFLLDEKYSGKSTKEKMHDVREKMQEIGADVHVVSDLCDIAWLLNVRGKDIRHVPVMLSHLILSLTDCYFYVKIENLNAEMYAYFEKNGVTVKDYDLFYEDLKEYKSCKILVDFDRINDRTATGIGSHAICEYNPETLQKAVKNPVEIENTKLAHIKDGVAVVKFMYWLKHAILTETVTEVQAANYMDALRAEQEHFVDISFDTIAAYGANAAMMHYQPDEKYCATLKPEGFLLVDSGGHYLEGSTDITRTFALGNISQEEREMFTAVLRGNLALANAKFLYGCNGRNLDILARQPLWQLGKDYRCGTGHGNGYLLNVHEGPNSFRWRMSGTEAPAFEEGMITTDEPGIYEEGRYGIRIENELLCKKAEENEYGQFMEFENITYAPIDLDAICPEQMTKQEKAWLNDYHAMVYDVIAPYLEEEEKQWLAEYTRAI